MRILALNHTAAVSGAELSLMRLVEGLSDEHTVAVACPPSGALPALVDRAGVQRFEVPPFEASLRLHPLQTPVGVAQLMREGIAAARVAKRFGADLVHANSLRAGLVGALTRGLGSPPLVVRAHEHPPPSAMGRLVRTVLARSASAVVAVSRHTADGFNEGLAEPLAETVYNSIDQERFDPGRVTPAPLRAELGLTSEAALLGQVAQITPWKGQANSIRALADLRSSGVDAHLVVVGEVTFAGKVVRYDNRAYLSELHALAERLELGGAVHFLGRREDVPELLAALDLSLLPSWNEPFGMVTVESMAMGTPPLVSGLGAGPELVEDRVTGRLLDPADPGAWAQAARELLSDRAQLARMGAAGRQAAAGFRDADHAAAITAVYERVLGDNRGSDLAPDAAKAPAWRG
jgi:glycosyltransferase involved in cell wall biosynthesis